MRIKKAWIDYAEECGACKMALKWLRRAPRTRKEARAALKVAEKKHWGLG